MPQTSSTPYVAEVAYRGVRKTLGFGFFEDDDQNIPIIPFDTNLYPKIQIIQPDGQVYLTRSPPSVRPSGNTGFWAFDFDVPPDASVTAINEAWEFAAMIVDANGIEKTYRTTFIVKDPTVVKSGNQSRFYPVVKGHELRVMYRSPVPLDTVSLNIIKSGVDDNFLVQNAVVGNGQGDIKYVISGGIHVYYYDIRAYTTAGVTLQNFGLGIWQAHWSIKETPIDLADLVYQIIQVFPSSILEYVPHVRFVVDKLEKRSSVRQSYSEADILGALDMGVQMVNTVFPATSWVLVPGAGGSGITGVPPQIRPYVILGAAWWLYIGQLGLAVDLQFNFSGQRTNLDQDQTGGIESLLDKYRSMLFEQLKEVKTDLLRQSRMVGVVATRPARARYIYNSVFRIDNQVSSNVISFLGSIGLF